MNSLFIPCFYLLHTCSIFFVARRIRLTSYCHLYANKTLLRTDLTTHISSNNICARYGALVRSDIRFNRPISILCVGPTMRWCAKIPPTHRGWTDGDIVHFMQRYAHHSFWERMSFRWICGMLHAMGCKQHSNTRTAMVGGRRLFFLWFLIHKKSSYCLSCIVTAEIVELRYWWTTPMERAASWLFIGVLNVS